MYFAEVGREHQKSKTLFRNPNEPTFFFPRAEPSGSTTGCSASAGINEDVMEIRCNKWLWAANALQLEARAQHADNNFIFVTFTLCFLPSNNLYLLFRNPLGTVASVSHLHELCEFKK